MKELILALCAANYIIKELKLLLLEEIVDPLKIKELLDTLFIYQDKLAYYVHKYKADMSFDLKSDVLAMCSSASGLTMLIQKKCIVNKFCDKKFLFKKVYH